MDKQSLQDRLLRLRDYLGLLDEVKSQGLERYRRDPLLRGAGERYFQLSLEILLDIGSHVIAQHGLSKPDTYADIFRVLADSDLIADDLYGELEGLAGFRNLLVHDYLRLDSNRVFQLLQEKLPLLERLASTYEGLIEPEEH